MITAEHKIAIADATLAFNTLQRLANDYATSIPYLKGNERITKLERYHELLDHSARAANAVSNAKRDALQALYASREVTRDYLRDMCLAIGVVPTLGLLDELVETVTTLLEELT